LTDDNGIDAARDSAGRQLALCVQFRCDYSYDEYMRSLKYYQSATKLDTECPSTSISHVDVISFDLVAISFTHA